MSAVRGSHPPLSGAGLTQRSGSNGGSQRLNHVAEGTRQTAEVVQCAGANGKSDDVGHAGVHPTKIPSLHPTDPEVGEGERPCLRELQACGDFTWSSGVESLGQKGFLADVESGCFGVEVLGLHPEPHEGPPLLLECLALGDSTDVSGAAALCGDCLVAASSLTCQ